MQDFEHFQILPSLSSEILSIKDGTSVSGRHNEDGGVDDALAGIGPQRNKKFNALGIYLVHSCIMLLETKMVNS